MNPKCDITEVVLRAQARSENWRDDRFTKLCDEISLSLPHVFFDWDKGAGEDWATFAFEEGKVAYLSRTIPLLLMIDIERDSFGATLEGYEVETIFGAPNETNFCIQSDVLIDAFECDPSILGEDDFDISAFSLGDLWFYTV